MNYRAYLMKIFATTKIAAKLLISWVKRSYYSLHGSEVGSQISTRSK